MKAVVQDRSVATWPQGSCPLCHQMRPTKPPGAGLDCRVCVYVLCVGGVPPNKPSPQGLCRNVHQEVPRREKLTNSTSRNHPPGRRSTSFRRWGWGVGGSQASCGIP